MPGWEGFDGTYIHAADRVVQIAALPFVRAGQQYGQEYDESIHVALERRTGDAAPHIALSGTEDVVARVTLDEAEQYAHAVLELVRIGRRS